MCSRTKAAGDKIDLVSKSQLPWDKKVTETPLSASTGKEMGLYQLHYAALFIYTTSLG